ncbi:MAG: nucleotidyltransferase family protein [Rickettsiales bacterium]
MTKIKQAIVLSAGLGTRMKELTQDIPKPMLLVDGVSLIQRHLQYLYKNNIHKVVINSFYKAEIFENFVKSLEITSKLDLHFSREDELLGTAGGVKNALKILGNEPFFVINSDALYIDDDATNSSFIQLENNWKDDSCILTLLAKKDRAFGYWGKGDFDLNHKNQITLNKEDGQFIHAGMQLMNYKVFENYPEKILQFYPTIYSDFIAKGKLLGFIYQGKWLHIGDVKAYETYKLD